LHDQLSISPQPLATVSMANPDPRHQPLKRLLKLVAIDRPVHGLDVLFPAAVPMIIRQTVVRSHRR
jgi:hypothetical protein